MTSFFIFDSHLTSRLQFPHLQNKVTKLEEVVFSARPYLVICNLQEIGGGWYCPYA